MTMTLQQTATPSFWTSVHNVARTANALTDAVATTAELLNNSIHHISDLESKAYAYAADAIKAQHDKLMQLA